MTPEEARERAIRSLLDVVEELAFAVGDADWAQTVHDSFEEHRRELMFSWDKPVQEPRELPVNCVCGHVRWAHWPNGQCAHCECTVFRPT